MEVALQEGQAGALFGRRAWKVQMLETRRKFLLLFGTVGASLNLLAKPAIPQIPKVPPPTAPRDPTSEDDAIVNKNSAKAALEENDKDIKKKIEKLYELATALKAEVEKTDSAKVLSFVMIKKAEEIEKLAREIKTRARG